MFFSHTIQGRGGKPVIFLKRAQTGSVCKWLAIVCRLQTSKDWIQRKRQREREQRRRMKGGGGGGRETEGGCQSSLLAVALVCCQRHYPPYTHLPARQQPYLTRSDTLFLGSAEPHTACSLLLRVWASVCVLQQTLRRPSSRICLTVLTLNSHPSLLHLTHALLYRLAKFSCTTKARKTSQFTQ